MNPSFAYYKRFYWLVAAAIVVMTTVITGSVALGDSVRRSLEARVSERLAGTETIVQTGAGFLCDSILQSDLLRSAHGFLLVEGFVSSNGQLAPVTVWGTDNDSLNAGEALVNDELKKKTADATLVLHLPSSNLVPSASLFVSQRYATQLRLSVKGVKSGENGGNVLLHNEQIRPLNVFLSRKELAEALGVEGKVNVILSPDHFTADDFSRCWKPEYSGLTCRHDSIIGTDRVFLANTTVEALKPKARYLAYFVNSLGSIPYSFVTATDQLHADETVLSDYAARRLNAHVGDSVTMDYYVSRGELKQLETRSRRFCVSGIVPVSQLQQQAELISADFPGLSGVERCTDWDSDLPIDMSRIRPVDEDYWATYRQTPKALVSLDAVGNDWIGSYGSATKIVVDPQPSILCPQLSTLNPQTFGIAVLQPRQAALLAARSGTDFGGLFLALGFFIIVAAILLMRTPLSEMYQLRREEIHTYSLLGFRRGAVFRRLFVEALPPVLLPVPVGVLLGYAYAALLLWLLSGPWSGATHTDGFFLEVSLVTIAVVCLISVAIVLVVLGLSVRSALQLETVATVSRRPTATRLLAAPSCSGIGLLSDYERRQDTAAQPFSRSALLWTHLKYYRRQHRLSFWTLALGVLVVFAVGLNRPDASHFSATTSGGYALYGESRIPIPYDLNTPASRHHLHLDSLPRDLRLLQLPKHAEDEASCLNLNRVSTPSVLGMPLSAMARFGIDTTLFAHHQPQSSDLIAPIPIAIDQESLLWSMMQQVGDTLTYHASDGRQVQAVIAATYPTGIFHGNAIMPLHHYRQLWPDEMGSRIILSEELRVNTLHSSLSDYGLTIMPARERLQQFFEVTDTYLNIFLSLGGLGLLLGLATLLIVVRKNMAARRTELQLYQTLGFTPEAVVGMLRREQLFVLLSAIIAGGVLSLLPSFLIPHTSHLASPATWVTAFVLFVLMLLLTWMIIHKSINLKTIQQCETF